ncbi:MAG TPA: polyprenyl synthetase family protein [Verrucomicrobiae bacterium]|nr:polyprenyl synthetase family protein [Verrucomicrobiae bacterium]
MAIAAPMLRETADVVSRLAWSRGLGLPRSSLGLPARLTLRAAASGDRAGVEAVHAAAAAELVERALEWHHAAATRQEPVALATLAGDYCLARASQALAGHTGLVVQTAFARGVASAAAALAAGGDAPQAARCLLPACGLAGAVAARLPGTVQARWWRAGAALAAGGAPPRETWGTGPESRPGDLGALAQLQAARDPVQAWLGGRLLLDPPAVAGPMARLLGAGGKRLRAGLVLLAAEVGPEYDPDRAVVGAAAIELLHAATLCHDDLVDGASSRRGAPTVASDRGALVALAVGDHYLGRAAELLCGLGDPGIARAVTRALVRIAEAQLRELERRRRWSAQLGPYRQVAVGKTGALLTACVETGARLGRATPEQRRALVRYAQLLGLAFQGIDDCLDFADPERTGKPAGLDLAQGLCTLPVICALRGAARGPVMEALRRLDQADLGRETEAASLSVVALVRGSGALAAARALADEWSAAALDQLTGLPPRAHRRLAAFADRLVVRDR